MVFCGNPSEWRPNAPFLSIKLVKTARRLEMCLAVELDLNITHYDDLYMSCRLQRY